MGNTIGGKSGEKWKSTIYFDPRADSEEEARYEITEDELRTRMGELVDDEKIINVSVYKVSLSYWQLTNFLFFHAFVVIETDKWWWSIEKDFEGLTIQRSKILKYVKDCYRKKNRRSNCTLLEEDGSNFYLMDLVDWLYKSNQLHEKYHLYSNNCQDFAKALFNKIAKKKLFLSLFKLFLL